jgi:predicted TIM-barrel fold metal-dependent hydrolase
MAELATCPNVAVKLGGIFMEVNGFGWNKRPKPPTSDELAEAARPYHDFVIDRFGVDRCIFESNFPVEKISCSYAVLWNSFKKIARGASASEKAKLFHDNATRIYRLSQ